MRHAWLLVLASCGSSDPKPAPDTAPDTAAPERFTCAPRPDAAAAAPYSHTTAPTGPRASTACVNAGCHLAGQLGTGATAFAFAGTVFKDNAGTIAAPRLTVRVFKPFEGAALARATTDAAGIFVIRDPLAAFPYQVDVTACGASIQIRQMSSELTQSDQSCSNGGICHGGSEGPVSFAD